MPRRPHLVFDPVAAQKVVTSVRMRSRATKRPWNRRGEQGSRAGGDGAPVRAGRARRGTREKRLHAVLVQAGWTSIAGCEISSSLPYASICVSGPETKASLEATLVHSGGFGGGGVLACGKAFLVAHDCCLMGLAGAGAEARGGSTLSLTRCLIKKTEKGGVFLQGFSAGKISKCEIHCSGFAGVEVLRNSHLVMDTSFVVGSRRGGVLVHVGSEVELHHCHISGSRMAGVDVRTAACATVQSCRISGGRASGIYVSSGGEVTLRDNVIEKNLLEGIEVQEATREGGGRSALVHLCEGNVITENGGDGR
ncbi:unnamed protein product [Discosporangium mesarthrocarpum]